MSLIRRLLNAGRDERLSREIEREVSFHIREHVEALMLQGWSEADARQEARRRFGNPTFQRERTRDSDVVAWLDSLRGELFGPDLRPAPADDLGDVVVNLAKTDLGGLAEDPEFGPPPARGRLLSSGSERP